MHEAYVVAGSCPCITHFMKAKRCGVQGLCMTYTLYVEIREENKAGVTNLFDAASDFKGNE